MIIESKKVDVCQNRFDGKGEVILEHIADEKLISDKLVMYARIILKPGCSLGYHTHTGNSETIYVISGTGTYCDNGKYVTVKSGDSMLCPDGESHSIENTGTQDLILMGLVVKS